MNRWLRGLSIGALCGVVVSIAACDTAHPPAPEPPTPAEELANPLPPPDATARKLVSALAAGDFEGSTADFDRSMKDSMKPEQMHELWVGLTAGKGNFTEVSGVTMSKLNENDLAIVTCAFEEGQAVIQVTIDLAGKVAGIVLR